MTSLPRRRATTCLFAVLLAALAGLAAGCRTLPDRPTTVPVSQVRFGDGGTTRECLLVFLPGIDDMPADFARHDFPVRAREAGVACDMIGVDTHAGYFFERSVVDRLHHDVVVPARRAGYRQVWLAGISLGGLGALLYARQHPQDVAGVVLLGPYLGEKAIVEEIRTAGGVAAWTPGPKSVDWTGPLWTYIKSLGARRGGPAVILAYGRKDRYVDAQRLLADVLPAEQVFAADGGHDWETWQDLWRTFLATPTLPRTASAAGSGAASGGS